MCFVLLEMSLVGKPGQTILHRIHFIYQGLKLKTLNVHLVTHCMCISLEQVVTNVRNYSSLGVFKPLYLMEYFSRRNS
jgi:hypothetical protein